MPHFLYHVADLFLIRGRGVVVVADRTWDGLESGVRIRVGDPVEFRHPERDPLRTTVRGIAMGHVPAGVYPAESLTTGIESQDLIALRSEVWLLETDEVAPGPA